ncbi:MAG: serine hydrolase [Aquabacterium sp.]|nr:serine hydrolase [Aquabacterium sp.]
MFSASLIAAALIVGSAAQATQIGSIIASIPAGNGFTSLDICTRTNVSGDAFKHVRDDYTAPMVQPLPMVWFIVNKPGTNVTTSAAGLLYPRIGAYRKGMGCTVIRNAAAERALRAQPFAPIATKAASTAPWPAGEGSAEVSLLTSDQQATLTRHADALFKETETNTAKRTNSYALLVAKNGHLVFERYASNYNREQRQIGWSMTKSLTAIVAGLMEKDGQISADAPVGLKSWSGTAKAAITWRQLLNMASGLQWDESGATSPNDVYEMLFNNEDDAAYAANKPQAYAPGSHYTYNTGAQTIAMAAMKEKLGGTHQAIYNYYQTKLFAPLGIRNGIVEPDYAGTPIGGARGVLRPVDWLRLGQLLVNEGAWNGQQMLSRNWVNFMMTPSPANPAYAGSIWTKSWSDLPDSLRARLPDDTVFFAGLQGQFVVMIPSHQLLLARMGVTFDPAKTNQDVFSTVADLVEQGL